MIIIKRVVMITPILLLITVIKVMVSQLYVCY